MLGIIGVLVLVWLEMDGQAAGLGGLNKPFASAIYCIKRTPVSKTLRFV